MEKGQSLQSLVGKIRQPHEKKMTLDHYVIQQPKMISKWIKHLNLRPETIKLLQEITASKLIDTGTGDDFLKSDTKSKSKQVALHQTKS